MPPFPGDNLRKILPSEYSIIYTLKSETCKAIHLLLFIAFISCLPYWTLIGMYLHDTSWYIKNDMPYVWIYVRCFWNSCFLIALYHPIYHIRPSNLICISLLVFLIFDGFDTLFAYYYLHVDVDSQIDSTITSLILYMKNKQICNIFNCTFINTYHTVLFIITFPLMNLFALFILIIYLKCFTVYGTSHEKKYSALPHRRSSFVEMSLSQQDAANRSNLFKSLLNAPSNKIKSYHYANRKDPNKLSLDEKNFILTDVDPDHSSINSITNSKQINSNSKSGKRGHKISIGSIKSLNSDLQSPADSIVTLNAELDAESTPLVLPKELSQSKLVFGVEAVKKINERRSLKNPSIDSSHLQIWYGSQVIRTKRSLDESLLQLINVGKSDLPISTDNLWKVILLSVLMCCVLLLLFFGIFCWYFVQDKYIKTPWGGLAHYGLLLCGYAIFNGVFNKITVEIDRYRQYYYDVSVQMLMQVFIDSLYWLLYRYSLLLIMPLMTNETQWFIEHALIVILLHNIFHIMLPGFLFASETFYEWVESDSLPCLLRKILFLFNIHDADPMDGGFNDWRERYSLLMVISTICCIYSCLTGAGFIIEIYWFGDNNNSIDNMHDIHEGTVYVLLSVIIEILGLLVMNYRRFEGAMIEPMLRLYELNPVRLLLSVGVILACTMNMFGQTLFQETLAGVHYQ